MFKAMGSSPLHVHDGTTSSTTFKVRVGATSGTTTINGLGGARKYGGVNQSSMTISEIRV